AASEQIPGAPDVRRESQQIVPGAHLLEIYRDPVVETCEWRAIGCAVEVDVLSVARIRCSPVLVPVDGNRKARTPNRSSNLFHLRIRSQQTSCVALHRCRTYPNCVLELLIQEGKRRIPLGGRVRGKNITKAISFV